MKTINNNELRQTNGGCLGLEHSFTFFKNFSPTISPDPAPPIGPVSPMPPKIKLIRMSFEVAFI